MSTTPQPTKTHLFQLIRNMLKREWISREADNASLEKTVNDTIEQIDTGLEEYQVSTGDERSLDELKHSFAASKDERYLKIQSYIKEALLDGPLFRIPNTGCDEDGFFSTIDDDCIRKAIFDSNCMKTVIHSIAQAMRKDGYGR